MDFQSHLSAGIGYLERPGKRGAANLVLLHGIGSQAASFDLVLPFLPVDWRVIAWNAPGYGDSDPLPMNWPLASDYAGALAGLLDRLALDRVILVGHSLGALIAASYAAGYSDRVVGLVLASPALGHGVAPGGTLSAPAQARIDGLTRLGPEKFAAERAARLVFAPDQHPEIVARVQHGMAQVALPGYGQAARMLASGTLIADLTRITVPTDVIVGAEDAITPPEGARRTYAALKTDCRGSLVELPQVGHALYQQAPAAFAAALSKFTVMAP